MRTFYHRKLYAIGNLRKLFIVMFSLTVIKIIFVTFQIEHTEIRNDTITEKTPTLVSEVYYLSHGHHKFPH